MSAPTITAVTFDKSAYAPGDKITATVVFVPGSSGQVQSLTGVATDAATGQQGMLTVSFSVAQTDATTVTLTDTGSRTWTPVPGSQGAGQVQFTATA